MTKLRDPLRLLLQIENHVQLLHDSVSTEIPTLQTIGDVLYYDEDKVPDRYYQSLWQCCSRLMEANRKHSENAMHKIDLFREQLSAGKGA